MARDRQKFRSRDGELAENITYQVRSDNCVIVYGAAHFDEALINGLGGFSSFEPLFIDSRISFEAPVASILLQGAPVRAYGILYDTMRVINEFSAIKPHKLQAFCDFVCEKNEASPVALFKDLSNRQRGNFLKKRLLDLKK